MEYILITSVDRFSDLRKSNDLGRDLVALLSQSRGPFTLRIANYHTPGPLPDTLSMVKIPYINQMKDHIEVFASLSLKRGINSNCMIIFVDRYI